MASRLELCPGSRIHPDDKAAAKKDKEGGPWYPACPNKEEPCRNMCKVISTSDDKWMCERCNQQYDKCCRRYIFSLTLSDNTSTCWASVFNDQAEVLLQGHKADEVEEVRRRRGAKRRAD